MKLGAEPKKMVILGVLAAGAAASLYMNVLSGPDPGPRSEPASVTAAPAPPLAAAPAGPAPRAVIRRRSRSTEEFRPSLRPRRPEERLDPTTIDPTLRLDLLARVQSVDHQGGSRNLFQFSAAPPPPAPKDDPKIMPKIPGQIAQGETQPDEVKPAEPVKPPPPPITLKYYGYSTPRGSTRRTAFFLDGEDIFMAAEGETVKRRYKVVRIGVNSVEMEDLESKSRQTLPLQPEAIG